jgi:hypothetical protein
MRQAIAVVVVAGLVTGLPVRGSGRDDQAQARASCLIAIQTYDIQNGRGTGWGAFYHEYTGTITENGIGPTLYLVQYGILRAYPTLDYVGGTGTLNDGLIGTGSGDTHLFRTADQSVITLHLAQRAVIRSIELLSFDIGHNGIPGVITSVDVTLSGRTQTISAEGFGPLMEDQGEANPAHELIEVLGSGIGPPLTDTITLSSVQTHGFWSTWKGGYFAISEIRVIGTPVP